MSELSDIPMKPHWAIIKTGNVTIPGDERSRTNPGHGYPERIEKYITYEAFSSQSEWEDKIKQLTMSKYAESFRALKVEPCTIEINISWTGNKE